MNYDIRVLDAFSVIGQETELTGFQRKNVEISMQFWRTFNKNLKKLYLSQYGNWIKYAFMERRDGKLLYYCAIPKKAVVPETFILKEISGCEYLVAEHVGSMNKIYDTYRQIYQEILPDTSYLPVQEKFLHFEKYDDRFHWNRENSVIEIWIPISQKINMP